MPISAVAQEVTLRKVGNSAGIIIPIDLRETAGVNLGDRLIIDSPAKGSLTITYIDNNREEKLKKFEDFQNYMKENRSSYTKWTKGKTADDLIAEARDARRGL